MNNELLYSDLPPKLIELNQIIYQLIASKKVFLQNGDIGFSSAPSNIALLKYWGKDKNKLQFPLNSSLSFTLGGFRAFTKVKIQGRMLPNKDKQENFFHNKLFLNNNKKEQNLPLKMQKILTTILLPCFPDIAVEISSYNNFPTACGIASSAAGYAALIGALADLLQLEKHFSPDDLLFWLSEWARIGSGSATRSVFPKEQLFVKWNINDQYNNCLTFSATKALNYHPNWHELQHTVFILSTTEKNISSSEGHKFAPSSPFHAIRVAGLEHKMTLMEKALVNFDFDTVKTLTEEDALSMHSVMQTGSTPACYLTAETAQIISLFIKLRNIHNAEAFWTLDAGPNIHFLYMPSASEFMQQFLIECEKIKKTTLETLKNNYCEGLVIGKKHYLDLEMHKQLIGKL